MRFIPLFDLLRDWSGPPLTDNGIHPTESGYRVLAELIDECLFGVGSAPTPWRTSPQPEALRLTTLREDEWSFHPSRPGGMAYRPDTTLLVPCTTTKLS